MKSIYILLNNDNTVDGWSSTRNTEKEIEIEVEDNHPIFTSHPRLFVYNKGQLIKSDEIILKSVKDKKKTEIDNACKNAILEGFPHTINGEWYWFSYDKESQFNFTSLWELFRQNIITEQMWTVKNSGGEYQRILIDNDTMKELLIITDKHVSKKIAKFRDHYMSLIMEAKTVEEVEGIHWVTDAEIISEVELQAELDRLNNTPTVEQLQIENEGLRTALLELGDLLLGGLG